MWNVKTKVISVITGATGTTSKSFRKYVSNKCFVLLTQYRAGDKIKKNEMGWACGAYG